MPRPRKCRKVCCIPKQDYFGPLGDQVTDQCFIVMTLEEYETIRLIDYEGFTQEKCAEQMHVARTTVQAIYSEARNKLSKILVEGKMLRITGGNYELCKGTEATCECGGCHKHRQRRNRIASLTEDDRAVKDR